MHTLRMNNINSTSESIDKLNKKRYNMHLKTMQTKKSLNSNKTVKSNKLQPPLMYEARVQARVRSGYELTSRLITDLPEGSVLTVEEIRNNRVHIIGPIHGWLSIISKYGTQIIMPLNKHTAKIGGKVVFTTQNSQKQYQSMEAKIIDYNATYGLHKVQCKNGTQQWISLKDSNVHYMPKNQAMMNPRVVNPLKHSQSFFKQFFIADYPQFAGNKKIIIKNNAIETAKLKPSENMENKKEEPEKKRVDTNSNDNKHKKIIKSQQEFSTKMKNIEKKIINHLHLRGYHENHPDFWRYIAKAKEFAIARAEKERQKLLQSQKFEQQTRNN